jgi:hypothetical protein
MTNKIRNAGVGYGRPPRRTQFKKGQSGNPKGRPKGARSMTTVLERTLDERVIIVENGRRRSISKLEAVFKQLTNKALTGNTAALQLLLAAIRFAEDRTDPAAEAAAPLSDADRTVLRSIKARILQEVKNGQK